MAFPALDAPDRVPSWDVLRGIAVLGILLANMPHMSLAATLVGAAVDSAGVANRFDAFARDLVYFAADGKFITIFSLLFGAGLATMQQRAEADGRPFARTYARRLGFLLGAGLVHGTLVWHGDILASYALAGFIALALARRSNRTLAIVASALLLVGLSTWAGLALVDPDEWVDRDQAADGSLLSVAESEALQRREIAEVMASGDFLRMAERRTEDFVATFGSVVLLMTPRTLALFLLGVLLVRRGWLARPEQHRGLFAQAAIAGLAIGLPLHALGDSLGMSAEVASDRALAWTALYLGSLFQAAAYVGLVVLWCMSARAAALRARLAAVGRMAFTNYLSQSVITAILFNYCGLYDRVGRGAGLALSFAIFALQLAWSPWWLARFRMGPLEWLWRFATYGRRPRFRVRDA